MIITITGKLGSGKTYWIVNYIIEKYYVWKEEIFQYVPKGKVRVVTNIDGLLIDHVNLNDEIERIGIDKVFDKSYVDRDGNTIFIIDEAQNIFHRKYYDKNVFYFFQTSRHYGVDVLLITQDVDSLCKEIKILQEYEIRAEDRSRRPKNTFVYRYISGEDNFKRQLIKFDIKKAMLYRSRLKEESEKVPNVWMRYVVYACLILIVTFVGFKFMTSMWKRDTKNLVDIKKSSKKSSSVLISNDELNIEKEKEKALFENDAGVSKNLESPEKIENQENGKENSNDIEKIEDSYVPRKKLVLERKVLSNELLRSGISQSLSCSDNVCVLENL